VPLRQGPRSLAEQIEAEAAAARAAASAPATAEAAPAAPAVVAPVAPRPVASGERAVLEGKPGDWVAVAYADLRGYEGAAVRVVSVHGSRRSGTLANWNGAGMGLTLGAAEGGITLSMSPNDIRSIEIQVPQPADAPAGG